LTLALTLRWLTGRVMRSHVTLSSRWKRWVAGSHREITIELGLLVCRRDPVGNPTSCGGSGCSDSQTFDFTSQSVDLPGHVRVVTLERLDVVDG
jgi:hypothetical protein